MKYILVIIFLFSNFFSSAQSLVNIPTERARDFKIYSDTLEHTDIFPYNYDFLRDTNKGFHVDFKPIFNFSQSFDFKTKNLAYNYLFGLRTRINYTNKFRFDFIPYFAFFKPESFLESFVDTLSVIPNIGTIITKKNDKYTYGGFIGDFTYEPQKYIYFQIGRGKTFLGDGYRSLLLSDNSSPYWFFKGTVDLGNIKYLYMIARQKDFDFRYSKNYNDLFPKYTFTHYLSFNFLKRLNFSMFETVVTSVYDSLGAHRGLEFNYLNPVIFFRSVEMQQGSPDNVLVGFSGHLKIFKSGMIYGQIFIDEFILSHIKSPVKYWDEKYGFQAGMKFYNTFGLKRLFSQLEINAVRPYTYSHNNPIRAYTNNLQPLAHPLGANFIEAVAITSYSLGNFFAQLKIVYSQFGDNNSYNYGKNPILSYGTRADNEGVVWFQGIKTSLKYVQFSFGYQKWNYLLNFDFIYRHLQADAIFSDNRIFQISFGIPLFNRYYDWK